MYNLNILAVDDEIGMRHGIRRVLENFKMRLPDVEDDISFSVEMAETGYEAIEKINALHPDLILLDYKLPDLTGLEILEQIDNHEGTMLTIMITAYASLETAVSAIKTGAFDFLSKPFIPEELRAKVSKAAQSIILARHVKKLNEEKRQVRFQFISVLGHELKSPLSAVEGYIYMLKDKVLGDDINKYDENISRCLVRTEQMRKLIEDLLEMTKIESGTRKRELLELDLFEIASQSVETMLPTAKKREIALELNSESPIKFTADRLEIEIIFNNLISNSVKYNRDKGRVDIFLKKDGSGSITFIVKDTGIGMTKEECDKLFREFVRIKNPKTKNILGTGLGLSTVKKIAGLYNGEVTLDSQPDVGSTFTVILNPIEN